MSDVGAGKGTCALVNNPNKITGPQQKEEEEEDDMRVEGQPVVWRKWSASGTQEGNQGQ